MVIAKTLIHLSLLLVVALTAVADECKGNEFNDENCGEKTLTEDEDVDDESEETLAFDQWGTPLPGHIDPPDLNSPSIPDIDGSSSKLQASAQPKQPPYPPIGPPMNPPLPNGPPNPPGGRPPSPGGIPNYPPPPPSPPINPPSPPKAPPKDPSLPPIRPPLTPNRPPKRPPLPPNISPMEPPLPPDDFPIEPPFPPDDFPVRPPNCPPWRPNRPPWRPWMPPKAPFWPEDIPHYQASSQSNRSEAQLPTDCGRPGVSLRSFNRNSYPRIFSGYDALDGQFPSYVQLYLKTADQRSNAVEICGGSIISPYHILTAAHCLNKKAPEKTLIGPGIRGVLAAIFNGNLHRAQKHCISQLYHLSGKQSSSEPFVIYDVAIIKLQRPIAFTKKIQPICLPQQPLQYEGQQAYSIGMGLTYKNPFTGSTSVANSLKVLPVVKVQCDSKENHSSILCAQGNDGRMAAGKVCPGDSGGPVLALDSDGRHTIYGLHSYGAGFCSDYRDLPELGRNRIYLTVKCADVFGIRSEIDKLLAECA